jgi:uncharacterized membrane protein
VEVRAAISAAVAVDFPVVVEALEAAARAGAGKPMSLFTRLPKLDHDAIVSAIRTAELRTSGEIRVVVAHSKTAEPMAEAQHQFARLGMANTRNHNGVLIFIAPRSRNFAVIGDSSVHEKCGDAFWTELANAMSELFRIGKFTDGVLHGIECAGALLAQHFPSSPDDRNELPDQVEEV